MRTRHSPKLIALSALVAAALALPALGCAHESGPVPVGRTTVTSGGSPSSSLTDPEVAEILRTAFAAATGEANVATAQVGNHRIAEYARILHTEYGAALDEERTILDDRGIRPEASDVSQQITFDSIAASQNVFARQGADLDRAFLEREIGFQTRLLNVIDDQLLPAVRSQDLRNEILRVRPIVERLLVEGSHLETWLLTQPD